MDPVVNITVVPAGVATVTQTSAWTHRVYDWGGTSSANFNVAVTDPDYDFNDYVEIQVTRTLDGVSETYTVTSTYADPYNFHLAYSWEGEEPTASFDVTVPPKYDPRKWWIYRQYGDTWETHNGTITANGQTLGPVNFIYKDTPSVTLVGTPTAGYVFDYFEIREHSSTAEPTIITANPYALPRPSQMTSGIVARTYVKMVTHEAYGVVGILCDSASHLILCDSATGAVLHGVTS